MGLAPGVGRFSFNLPSAPDTGVGRGIAVQSNS